MPFLRKYGTGTGADIIIPLIKAGEVNFAATGDFTPASGDVKISKDGGAEANIGTLPVINGTYGWKFVFSDAELQAKSITIRLADSATKAVEDQCIIIETYGHASAMYIPDFSSALATPTNITAGTITTVTNLTNAPTNGDFTATMKTSITTAATAATPTAAAVTAGVTLTSATIDTLWDELMVELSTDPGATPKMREVLALLYMKHKNSETSTASAATIKNDAGTTVLTATLSDDATTFTKGKYS